MHFPKIFFKTTKGISTKFGTNRFRAKVIWVCSTEVVSLLTILVEAHITLICAFYLSILKRKRTSALLSTDQWKLHRGRVPPVDNEEWHSLHSVWRRRLNLPNQPDLWVSRIQKRVRERERERERERDRERESLREFHTCQIYFRGYSVAGVVNTSHVQYCKMNVSACYDNMLCPSPAFSTTTCVRGSQLYIRCLSESY